MLIAVFLRRLCLNKVVAGHRFVIFAVYIRAMNRIQIKTHKLFTPVQRLDLRVFNWCRNRKSLQPIAATARLISRTADGYFYPILAAIISLADPGPGGQLFLAMAIAFAVERPLYWVLKNSCRRNRPAKAIPGYQSFITASDQFSFPSGHTSGAFLTATLLSAFYPQVTLMVYIWATFVGMSRVVLGVHFPSDTLVGAGMGSLMAWCALVWVAV